MLSIGFWAPFMYAHWFIASTSWVTHMHAIANYPGVSLMALALVWVGALAVGRWGGPGVRRLCGAAWVRAVLAALACVCALAVGWGLVGGEGPTIVAMAIGAWAMLVLQTYWWERYACTQTVTYALSLCVGIAVLGVLKILMAVVGAAFVLVAGLLPWMCGFGLELLKEGDGTRGEVWFTPRVLLSLGRLAVGIVAFLVIWSVCNAFLKETAGHQGFGSTASLGLTAVIQLIDVGFAAAMAWWIAVRKGQLEYVQLWKIAYVLLCVSIVFLVVAGPLQAAQVFSTAAFVMAQVMVDLACGNVARHSSLGAVYVFGAGELVYNATDWLGRALVGGFGIVSLSYQALALLLFGAVVVLAFFLPARTVGSQYLLSDLNGLPPQPSDRERLQARCRQIAEAHGLSGRELEIVELLCQGRSKPYIAEALYLSENTVGTYTRRLYKKLDVHSKQELLDLVFADEAQ